MRSDRFEESIEYERTFVDIGIVDELENENHQILYGRRGTGKTHVLKVVEQRLKHEKRNVSLYLDGRTLGSVEANKENLSNSAFCLDLYRDIMTRIHWIILDYIVEYGTSQNADDSLKTLDEFLAAISEPIEQYFPSQVDEERQYARSTDSGLKGHLAATTPSLDLTASKKREDKISIKANYSVRLDESVSLIRVVKTLNSILSNNDIRLYILIDEWSAIHPKYQPAFGLHPVWMTPA